MEVKKNSKSKDYLIVGLASSIVFLIAVISYQINGKNENVESENQDLVAKMQEKSEIIKNQVERLRYWGVAVEKWHDMGHLRTMDRVFERLQYKFVNASHGDDWDIFWAIEYPLSVIPSEGHELFANVSTDNLREDQKLNHFPSLSRLVNKDMMNEVNAGSPYILPHFIMPHDINRLDRFIKKNPKARLVEKNNFNRGVRIVKRKEVDEKESENFYQQFMEDHFLIDGHAFDFGIFVLITSFDPLRFYRYDADVLFRFCKKHFHPFDPYDLNRYVVEDGCHNAFDMPSFEKTYQRYGFPFIKIFERFIEEKGHNVKEFWRKIDDAIVSIVNITEVDVINGLKRRNISGQNFFELVRFDFLIDNKMHPYVMEVNMSPNLTPAAKRYEENCNLYEPLIYNVIQMIGGGNYYEFNARFNKSDIVIANRKNIGVGIKNCLKYDCSRNCESNRCKICQPCVDEYNHYQMREAFREHTYENNFKRLFPTALHYYDDELIESMTKNNQISIQWFKAQCRSNKKWC